MIFHFSSSFLYLDGTFYVLHSPCSACWVGKKSMHKSFTIFKRCWWKLNGLAFLSIVSREIKNNFVIIIVIETIQLNDPNWSIVQCSTRLNLLWFRNQLSFICNWRALFGLAWIYFLLFAILNFYFTNLTLWFSSNTKRLYRIRNHFFFHSNKCYRNQTAVPNNPMHSNGIAYQG